MVTRLFLVLLAAGCTKRESLQPPRATPPPAPRPEAQSAQLAVPLGDEAPLALAFRIVKRYEKRKPSDNPPWHQHGGTWIFFDAETADAKPARFTFGMNDVAPTTEERVRFGKAQFSVADREMGGRLVSHLARAFKQAVPEKGAEHALKPLALVVAVLGHNVARLPSGGFSGTGDWTATKAFPQLAARESEVFFNFSLSAERGEFSQKDADYDKDMVAVFATLRDGMPPPPSRSPTR